MSITYPLSLPSSPPGLRNLEFGMNNVVGVGQSPYSGSQQAYDWMGEWWDVKGSLPPMVRADAERWIAWMAALRGRYGTFLLGDPLGKTPRGVATGTPLVNGAGQTGRSLVTDGWTPSITGILKAGDYIQLGTGTTTRLYKVMQDVNSNGSGQATLDIFPILRESPADNAAVTKSSCKGTFRLTVNRRNWTVDVAQTYGLGFEAVEAI